MQGLCREVSQLRLAAPINGRAGPNGVHTQVQANMCALLCTHPFMRSCIN